MGKFPLIFAKAVMFGENPSRHRPARINNGTACLLKLSCGAVAVTCYHVIDFYRKRLKAGDDCLFQIGECRFDPLSQLLSASPDADLAVLRLSDAQAREVTRGGLIGLSSSSRSRGRLYQWPKETMWPSEASLGNGEMFSILTL
jgi:hypothetical protein